MRLKLHAILESSRANGPGNRFVIWLQGCPINCPDCFNPKTHSIHEGFDSSTESVMEHIRQHQNKLEGITISGGEPFAQPQALAELVHETASLGLSNLIFSGYTLESIRRGEMADAILSNTDVLIAGPYRNKEHQGNSMLGSSNQRIHLLSSRYTLEDLHDIPTSEIQISPEGDIIISGITPPDSLMPIK